MGLDMYLTKKIYIGASWEHRKVKAEVEIEIDGKRVKINPEKITYIEEDVMRWRKANQIHKWFVDNVQKGKDNCASYDVSLALLKELKELCIKARKENNPNLLPPQAGFFFGSTEVHEDYWMDIDFTIEGLEGLDNEVGSEYQYQSSW